VNIARRKSVLRRSLFVIFLMLLASCGVSSKVQISNPVQNPGSIEADCTIRLRQLRFSGGLQARQKNISEPFLGAFAQAGQEIKCTRRAEYLDGILDVVIDTKFEPAALEKTKYIPVVGGAMYMMSGGVLNFNWQGSVAYSLFDDGGKKILHDAFDVQGQDAMEGQGGYYGVGVSGIIGAKLQSVFYPDEEALNQLSDQFLISAGREIAARLRTGPARSYFVRKTRDRDGMDAKTYAEFLEKKNRLIRERAASREMAASTLTGSVSQFRNKLELKKESLVVCAIGVDQYKHFPGLKYAGADSRRVAEYFKTRYHLSDDRVMVMVNEEATAIKTIRFIEQNAAKLLTEDDTFVFYFSGHGAPTPDPSATDGDGLKKYLLLSNSEPQALPLTAISLNDLAELLNRLPCKRVIVLIDSCFAGMAGKDQLARVKGIQISERTYKNIAAVSGKGRVILAACGENQVSQETDLLGAGVFTHYLLKGLNAGADRDQNGKVDILELYQYARAQVEQFTRGAQTPVFRGEIDHNIEF
jgi:hypothetical protein